MGLAALVLYGVGDMLGAGIYGLVGKAAAELGNATWMAFLVSMVAAAFTGLSYASLGSRYPRAAGTAYVVHRAFRLPPLSYVVGLAVIASGLTSMAAVSRIFGGYLQALAPAIPVPVAAVGMILLLSIVNFRGIRESSWVNALCTAVETGGLLIVILVGIRFWGSVDYLDFTAAGHPEGRFQAPVLLSASILTFYAFVGFEDMINVSEEVKDPRRVFPIALILAFVAVALLYGAIAITAVSVVPHAELARSQQPLVEVVVRAAPWFPPGLYTVIALFEVANTALINYVMGSRLVYGMACQGLLPAWLSAIHAGRRTPHRSILALMLVVLALALTGGVAALAKATSLLLLCVFVAVNASLLVLRRRPGEPRGTLELPALVPLGGIGVSAMLIANARPQEALIAVLLLAGILALYLLHRPRAVASALLAGLLAGGATLSAAPPGAMLGPPPRLAAPPDGDDTAPAGPGAARGAGPSVNPTDRASVVAFYHCVYLASEGFETRMNWQGDVARCTAGTVAGAFHEDTLRRINYYRAMAGLNADITFDPAKNAKCQEAALIMARNDGLSHDPRSEQPPWACLTPGGIEAAARSNLSLGTGLDYTGPRAVDGQMEDAGDVNTAVGHRRWLLYPRARVMGNGGIPFTPAHPSTAAIWVVGDFAPPPATPARISWPNAGYTPYPVVFPRWSFSLRGADFAGATVSMSRNGSALPLVKIHPTPGSPAQPGVGDPTLVWEPEGITVTAPAADTTYAVTIRGVAGAPQSVYSYTVTVIDPHALDEPIVISGPTSPARGGMNLYGLTPVAGADSYLVRFRALTAAKWTEGAEASPAPRIIDQTSPDYPLLSQDLARSGARSFHLAFPDFADQAFAVDRTLLPGPAGRASFHYRRRFSSAANSLACEISPDEGNTWQEQWSVAGICDQRCDSRDWDPTWLAASVSLAAYQGQPIRLRFILYHHGTAYIGTQDSHGVFIDDIQVADVEEPRSESVSAVPPGDAGFVFAPDDLSAYLLDAAARIGCFQSRYGPHLRVVAVEQTATPQLRIIRFAATAAELRVGVEITGGVFAALALERAASMHGPWHADAGAVYDPFGAEFTVPQGRTQRFEFLRIVGETP